MMLNAIFRQKVEPLEERGQATTWGTWPGVEDKTVGEERALKLLAVTGSVQLLTESISTLPVDVFRKTRKGRQSVDLPAWLKSPVIDLTFTDWCSQILTSLLLHGNSYSVVTRNAANQVVEVVPVAPIDVSVRRDGTMGGAKRYLVEVASDAEFGRDLQTVQSTSARLAMPGLARGKYFWRVMAVDQDGFVGMPSKVFAFVR